jgi:hypothetical protein
MQEFYLTKNTGSGKHKYTVSYLNKETGRENKINFGHRDYEDLTQHQDYHRKILYENRHRANENWNDLTSAGAFSKHLLWHKVSLKESIADMEKRFNIKIHY